ncbi:MAG: hypothetical protein KME20_02530 [Kaiparowitsia implicata GSE-PSE-MK54-09C]|nr:hypothetical protein [Kaiparowitsia implicata GSE-PSE-MK54-09C]
MGLSIATPSHAVASTLGNEPLSQQVEASAASITLMPEEFERHTDEANGVIAADLIIQIANGSSSPPYSPPVADGPGNTQGSGTR